MPRYLVEVYGAASDAAVRDARDTAARVAQLTAGVHHLRTTFLPDDETILHFFDAPSLATLERAGRQANLEFQRIVEAVEGEAPER